MIDAIRSLLSQRLPDGVAVFDTDATGTAGPPYVLVLAPLGGPGVDAPLTGDTVQADVIVRSVGVNAEHARAIQAAARAAIGYRTATTAGWLWNFVWDNSRTPVVDRDVTLDTSGTHPVYADDEFTAYGQQINS